MLPLITHMSAQAKALPVWRPLAHWLSELGTPELAGVQEIVFWLARETLDADPRANSHVKSNTCRKCENIPDLSLRKSNKPSDAMQI